MGNFRLGLKESPLARPGQAGINLGQGDTAACKVINIFKMAAITFSDPADASRVDADGYLTSTPSSNVSVTWSSASTGGAAYTGVNYKLVWPATISFKIRFNSVLTLVGSPTGATVTGGSGVGVTTIVTTSGAGSITFTNGASEPSAFWMNDGTFSRSGGEIAFYRVSDEADYLAGQYWTPEFRTLLQNMRPAYIRPMGWVNGGGNNYNGEVAWSDRIPLTQFSWNAQRILPTKWVGNISGTDTYACGSYTDMPVSHTDGEVCIGYVTNANTSATITLDVGSRGAKTVKTRGAGVFVTSGSGSTRLIAGLATFRYDGLLDCWLYSGGAYNGSIPLEAQIQLCNEAASPFWCVLPFMADDDYITSAVTLVRDTLDRMAYYEYGNEIWNNAFPQTGWSGARGQYFGWSTGGNYHIYGWYGLRVREIMGNLIPAVYGDSLSARVRRTMGYQGLANLTIQADRLNGAMLSTGIANAAFSTRTGGLSYNAFPDRPIDVVESMCPAPYCGGTNLSQGADAAGLSPALGANNLAFYQALVDAWVADDTATAYALIDEDIIDGRAGIKDVTASGTTFTTRVAGVATAHNLATGNYVCFDVTGGTAYSGVTTGVPYYVASVPTSSTFTIQALVGGVNSGAAVNGGSAGTGTTNVGQIGFNILLLTYQSGAYAETQATTYDAARSGADMPLLRADWYEGNLEPAGPSAAQVTTIGISWPGHTAQEISDAIAAALLGWKNATNSKEVIKTYYEAMTGLDPAYPAKTHTHHTSQLVLPGPGLYGLTSGPLPDAAVYELYNGFKEFNEENPQ
jgi:hypothetical protein